MRFIYTNGQNEDFVALTRDLDGFLNGMVRDEEDRLLYVPFNKPDSIHDVVLAYDQDAPVGCAGFRHYEDGVAEVKRVYVTDAYRRRGISRQLLLLLEQKAKEKGYVKFILESGTPLAADLELYRSMGYTEIPNYGPYRDLPETVCMEKIL
jgi:GNAT superfamily N-acetyltransferase